MSDSTTLKRCPQCGNEYPRTSEYFHYAKNRIDGFYNYCKKCAIARSKKYEKDNPDLVRAKKKIYAQSHAEHKKEYNQNWHKNNAERIHAKARENYKNNLSLFRTRRKAQYQKEKESAKEKAKEWYRKNKRRAFISAKVNVLKRMATKRSLPANFCHKDWQRALDYFDHRCAVCGRPRGLWHTLARDHWIPLSSPDCPGTIPSNIVPLCHGVDGCNNSKNDTEPTKWLIDKFGTRKANKIKARIESYFASLKEPDGV